MGRPERIPPAASLATADSCTVLATAILAEAGVTSTAATGMTATVIAAVPLFPSLVAVIVADPAPTAVTSPLAETVAAAGALLAQVTARPARGLPLASFGVAVIWTVCPSSTVAEAGFTDTDATGTNVTVIAAVPFWPSLL